MKILIATVLLIFLSSCSKHDPDLFRWPKINPAADSICIHIDQALVNRTGPDTLMHGVERLESIARANPHEKELEVRALYFRGRVMSRLSTYEPTELFAKAMELCDSARFPYDYHRIGCMADGMYKDDFVCLYDRILEAIKYAQSTHDEVLEAEALLNFNKMKTLMADTMGKAENLKRTLCLYRKLGFTEYELRTRMNIALDHIEKGDSAIAAEILDSLYTNARVHADPVFETQILINLGYLTRKPEYPRKALALANKHPEKINRHFILALNHILTHYLLLRDSCAEAYEIAHRHMDYPFDKTDIEQEIWFTWLNSARLDNEGKPDSALSLLRRSDSLQKFFYSHVDRDKAKQIETRYKIAVMQEKALRTKKDERLHWSLALTMTAIAALAAYMTVHHRLQRERLQKHTAQLERERYLMELEGKRRQLASSALVMTEKDNLLQSLLDNLEQMRYENAITHDSASRLEAEIRTHLSGKQEWEQFRAMFDKVNPSFTRKLRERYPDITEGDIKIAIYIKIGLSTKQIARMLLLQPESVKKNRHRLRDRMGLSPDMSLEETLRSLD